MKTLTINLNPNQLSPLNVFSQNVVAKYYVMFLSAKELKKARFLIFFKLLVIYCLNCIRHGRNATYEPGLSYFLCFILSYFYFFLLFLFCNLFLSVIQLVLFFFSAVLRLLYYTM